LENSAQLLGFVARPGELRRQAAVFLATAPAEPFGLSVVEAMAAGLPIVAADGGAHREILDDCGLLFPPGDVPACAALLRRLADSDSERNALGHRARQRQRDHLSLGAHVDRLEQVYDDAMAQR
jgi:glycosyltransferase involved in cell wall biosynthesis